MKRIMILLSVASLTLCACNFASSPPASNSSVAVPIDGNTISNGTVMDEKALYAAEVLYNVPAAAYVSADTHGLIPVALKATLKPKMIKLNAALKLVEKAYVAGNSSDFFDAVGNLQKLSDDAKKSIPAS